MELKIRLNSFIAFILSYSNETPFEFNFKPKKVTSTSLNKHFSRFTVNAWSSYLFKTSLTFLVLFLKIRLNAFVNEFHQFLLFVSFLLDFL